MVREQKIGRFELCSRVGSGSQAIVYLARDAEIGRDVAIKLLKPNEMGTDLAKANITQEARAVGRLSHPNIVPIYEVGEFYGFPYFVFEYVNGQTLAQVIGERPKMTIPEASTIMLPLIDAMAYAHAQGVLHLDLTPNNILFDENNVPRIMDFGLSRVVGSYTDGEDVVTGTPSYMSPEHFSDIPLGPYTDVFSLSLILFEMLTGKKAIVGDNMHERLIYIIEQSVDLSALPEGRDREKITYILQRGLAKDAHQRYADATVMKHALSISLNKAVNDIANGNQKAPLHGTIQFLLRRMQRKGDFPALSRSLSEINRMAADGSGTTSNQLATAVLKDYALTNKLLKMANSAFYASFGSEVSNVSQAIRILGFRQVRFAANSLSYFSQLQNIATGSGLQDTLIKSFLSGIIARYMAKMQKFSNIEEAFICGMFQNVGETLTAYYFPDEYEEISQLLQTDNSNKQAAAQIILGVNFSQIGSAVASSWNFPEVIVNAIGGSSVGGDESGNQLGRLAVFANELCHIVDTSDHVNTDTAMSALLERSNEHIMLRQNDMPKLLDAAYKMLQEYAAILGMNMLESDFCKHLDSWIEDHLEQDRVSSKLDDIRSKVVENDAPDEAIADEQKTPLLPKKTGPWYRKIFPRPAAKEGWLH